jgi:hypothetical protein
MRVPGAPRSARVVWGPRTEAVASKESWNGCSGAGTVVAATAKGSQRRQRARETKICQVIQAEKRVPNV